MKLSMMIALGLALTAGVTLAKQSVYDDLGVPQSCRDDTAFWTLTGHAGPTVDTVDLEVKGLDSTLPSGDAVVTTGLVFDALPIWFALSLGTNLDSTQLGALLLLR